MIRLIQLCSPEEGRKVALVQEPFLILLKEVATTYELALRAIKNDLPLEELAESLLSSDSLEYDPIYAGTSTWEVLPSFDHPDDPCKCLVSGTGLTHKSSAMSRNSMHGKESMEDLSDSMRMYIMGTNGGKPRPGEIGVQPEWFYKGNGTILKGHNERLHIPPYSQNGGEEPEIAGIYICDDEGHPHRVGFAMGNEFSDHVMEKENYLYLAPSKIRNCAIGPELVVGKDFESVAGTITISRNSKELWSKEVQSGEENMAHSLANLEYHHFKYENHRLPGMAHVHFFGADAFSFGNGVLLKDGDEMEVHWNDMGRSLKNRLEISVARESLIDIKSL